MVLKDRQELVEVWGWMKQAAAENLDTPTIMLMVAQNVDSLAACAILQRLLEEEQLSHKVVPVCDYADLSRIYTEQVADSSELRSIVLINLGGIVDLMGHLQASLDEADEGSGIRRATELPHPDCRWYVFDSHRPFALENLMPSGEESEQVYVIHDGDDDLGDEVEELLQQVAPRLASSRPPPQAHPPPPSTPTPRPRLWHARPSRTKPAVTPPPPLPTHPPRTCNAAHDPPPPPTPTLPPPPRRSRSSTMATARTTTRTTSTTSRRRSVGA